MKQRIRRYIVELIIRLPGRRKIKIDNTVEPIWILGMFRSGTSFLSNVLHDAGLDFGKTNYLLQARGFLKDLNPKGFYEDFVFAEISRFILYKIDKSGVNPPDVEETKRIFFDSINTNELIRYSFFKIKDDRISFENKVRAYLSLKYNGINGYLHDNFKEKFAIKIPLLTFFHTDLLHYWPNSKFIIVFRNPSSVIKSSQILTKTANLDLYRNFYEHLIDFDFKKNIVMYLSYDRFLKDPESDIKKLSDFTGISEEALKINYKKNFDESLIRNKPISNSDTDEIEIYKDLLNKSC